MAEYTAVLPIIQHDEARAALIIVGGARDPFTALDQGFLVALGQQVGAALENADLYQRLTSRAQELERLSASMARQNEEQRRRLSLELHDETAQVFAAVKLQLGLIREQATPGLASQLERALDLMDTGIKSIRNITNDLRPPLLDDLGWLPAIRALSAEFAERTGLTVHCEAGADLPAISKDAELALFRAVQEALANVIRHAAADSLVILVTRVSSGLQLRLRDDGRGFPAGFDLDLVEQSGHLGLAGMRERIGAVGGSVEVAGEPGAGVRISIVIPESEHA
jgi:signal transduction histidine kinase